MKRILVPCDFEASSLEAFKFAVSLAKVAGDELFVLNVLDLPTEGTSALGVPKRVMHSKMVEEMRAESEANFERMREQAGDCQVSFSSAVGEVRPVINSFIVIQNIDLVIMGTHGSTGLEDFFIGSNTDKMVRTSPVPVISVTKAVDAPHIKNIVFPSTLDLNQQDLIDRITDLQKMFHAHLHILLVETPAHLRGGLEEMRAFEEFAKHYKLSSYTVHVRGDAHEQDGILHFAEEINAEMIAMGTHGRRGLAHLFSGSIAEKVLHTSKYLVWTYAVKKVEIPKGKKVIQKGALAMI